MPGQLAQPLEGAQGGAMEYVCVVNQEHGPGVARASAEHSADLVTPRFAGAARSLVEGQCVDDRAFDVADVQPLAVEA